MQTAVFSLNSHGLSSVHAGGERVHASSLVSLLIRTVILSDRGLMTSFNLNYLLKTLSPNIFTLGVRASTYEFWEDNSVHSNVVLLKDLHISTEPGGTLSSGLPHFPRWESLAADQCDKTVITLL